MKSYYAQKGKGLASLHVREQEVGVPGKGEVLIKMKAAALNFRELMIINNGVYPLPIKDPFIPLTDGAGEVAAIGEGVTLFKPGDRVSPIVFPKWADGPFSYPFSDQLGGSLDGMLTEYVVISELSVVSIPSHLSWEEAATLPCAGVTAWNALTSGNTLLAGETVLTMGTGGVSLFALQFAKLFGASVIATTSTEEKAAFLRDLGADHVINYLAFPDWHLKVKEITGGRGIDHIIEVGGSGTLERSLRSLSLTGEVNMVGWLSNEKPMVDISAITASMGSTRRIALGNRRHHMEMNRAVDLHKVKPVIDKVFHFDEAREAFEYFARGKYLGKVVISL